MSYKVSAADLQNIKLGEANDVERILQNVAVIICSRMGDVPLMRDFGLSMDFLDRPHPAAKALIYQEVREAVSLYEPRAEVVDVEFDAAAAKIGLLIPIVEVNIINE